MVRMESFSVVPPHIHPPMAQVPSAIRELIRFVPFIPMYSSIVVLLIDWSVDIFLGEPLQDGADSVEQVNRMPRGLSSSSEIYFADESTRIQDRPLSAQPKRACSSICRITAEKSCSSPCCDCRALTSKAALVAGIRTPTAAARLRISLKSLFISRSGNCGL